MGRRRKGDAPDISPSVIDDYKRRHPGISQKEIADVLDVTPQWVSAVKQQGAHYRTPREIAMDHYPWTVGRQFNASPLARYTADHLEYMATGGEGMSPRQLKRLRGFYNRLQTENVVVEFDPNIEPIPGVSKVGGFAYRKRVRADQGLIIRVNEFTRPLSEEGRLLWRMPPQMPEVE